MAAKIFRINYKSDFILTLNSDAGWMTPFCIKFWTGVPSQAYYVGWDGETYTHCAYNPSEPTKLVVQFDDHHLPIGDLKYQVAYHFTVADFPNDTEDEVMNQASITTEIDGETYQVMLDFNGETAPEIQFALPAYANEAQRIANEEQRIANEQQRIRNEETRIDNEQTRINQESARVNEYAELRADAVAATGAANDAATLANQKAGLADDAATLAAQKAGLADDAATLAAQKAGLADDAATLATQKAGLADDAATLATQKAGLADDAATLATQKAGLADDAATLATQKAQYAQDEGDYAKAQGDYAKSQADLIPADVMRTASDAAFVNANNEALFYMRQTDEHFAGLMTSAEHNKLAALPTAADLETGIIYDVSSLHPTSGVSGGSTYESLSAALSVIPQAKRKGGMSVKFVQSSDNKYMQYFLTKNTWSVSEGDWQKINLEEEVSNKADLVDCIGKNLYDKSKNLAKLINTVSGNLQEVDGWSCSDLIPVTPGATYYLYRGSLNTSEIRGLLEDGTTKAKILNYYTNQETAKYILENSSGSGVASGPFKVPNNVHYVQFNVKTVGFDASNIAQLEVGDEYTDYEPYEVYRAVPKNELPRDLATKNDLKEIEEEVRNKADLIVEYGKNLFDKSQVIYGYFVNSITGALTSYENTAVSPKIEITPGSVYHISRPNILLTGAVVFTDKNENRLKPLKIDGTEWSNYEPAKGDAENTVTECKCKAPATAKYIQFTVIFSGNGNVNNTQIELGPDFTGYEEYYGIKKSLPYAELPKELIKQLDNIGTEERIINIKNSDKIGFFSNSFLEGYAMLGKHAIEKLMMFSDYLPYNYSRSGDDMIEESYRLDKDQTYLGVCKPSEIGSIKYGIIMHQDNDGIMFTADHRTYYENAKKLGYEIMSLGGQPIISTEHDWQDNYLIFQRLCQDEGWRFANWGKVYNDIPIGQYNPMWYSHHPASRSNWCQVHGLLPIIEALPRPVQSIKLFRLRSFVDATDLKSTLYNTILERAEHWIELHNGQVGIESGQEAKFDRFGDYQLQTYNCEYQNLIKNISTSFGSHLLADITTPYNIRSISKFTLNIIGTGISKLYARQIRYMDNSWLPTASSRYIAFGITAGENLLHVGDTITISGISRSDGADLNKSYTISGIANGYVVTTEVGSNHTTSGTDNPTCDVSGVTLSGSYKSPSGEYMENYNKPIGQWTEIAFTEITGGISVDLTAAQIEKFGVADKFVFMATGTNIAITDIFANVVGSSYKERHEKSIIIPEPKVGQSALSTTTFAIEDTAWENLANIPIVTPVTDGTYIEQLPGTVREISTNGWLAQQLDTTKFTVGQYKKPLRIQIQILARWFPKYILTDEDYATSELTPDTFDMAKLEVQLNGSANPDNNSQFPVTTMYIGAWWNVYVFEMDLVGAPTWLTLKCVDKRVQIAKCDIVVLNPQS